MEWTYYKGQLLFDLDEPNIINCIEQFSQILYAQTYICPLKINTSINIYI